MEKNAIDFLDFRFHKEHNIIVLNRIAYEPPRYPWNIAAHSHNSFEIHFIINGTGTVHFSDKSCTLQKNIFYITGPNVTHSQTSDTIAPMEEYALNINIISKHTPKCVFDEFLQLIISNPTFLGSDNFDGVAKCMAIYNEARTKEIGYREKIEILLYDLIISMGRTIAKEFPNSKLHESTYTVAPNKLRALDVQLRRYTEPNLTPDIVAKEMYISKRQLSRIIRSTYDMTFTEEINSLRVEYAKELLLTTDLNITAISSIVGYNSIQQFSKMFNKYAHISPTKYREKHS